MKLTLPRSLSGLRKDGRPDKRFTGATMANLQKWMEEAAGTTLSTPSESKTATQLQIEKLTTKDSV